MDESQSVARLQALYGVMLLIRTVESTLAKVFADGEVPGFIHLSIGQEAVAAGIAAALTDSDTLATTHRGHGHVLAKGLDLEGFFKEVLGKEGGVCGGRGGSMHVSDMRRGIIGANGIVGAGIPIALGSALAMRTRETRDVAVAVFGDGAMAEGVLHESMNFSALLHLPLLLVCENNGWSEFSPTDRQCAAPLSALAQAFGIAYESADGNDVLAVAGAAELAVAALRAGAGPRVLECHTHRARGHFEGDAQQYRPKEEANPPLEQDPLARAESALRVQGARQEALDEMRKGVELRVQSALQAARADAWPAFESALRDVYTAAGVS